MTHRTIQLYRGTEAQNDAYTGSAGELTMDTTNNKLRLHDGSTAGGHEIGGGSYHPDLFDHKWADHLLNDVSWLRADTFSWQDGSVYEAAYNHLADDITGKSLTSETIGSTTVQFYLADDGHKICPASEESNVASIYTATGVAWYYILDTANTRFKLPRSKHNKYASTLGVVGNGKSLGFDTGITSPAGYEHVGIRAGDGGTLGAFVNSVNAYGANVGATGGSGTSVGKVCGVTTDPTKSGIIAQQTEDTDQYKYLYFYVGNFTQTALENTAGLNASLFNAKADIDASNFDATGKSTIANLGMPSDTFDSLTLGASGTEYTAPANGWVQIVKNAGSDFYYVSLESRNAANTGRRVYDFRAEYSSSPCTPCIPVRKGQKFIVRYNATGTTTSFRFYYAQGDI